MLAKHSGFSQSTWEATSAERKEKSRDASIANLRSEKNISRQRRRTVRAIVKRIRREGALFIQDFCRTVTTLLRLRRSGYQPTVTSLREICSRKKARSVPLSRDRQFVRKLQKNIRRETLRDVTAFVRRVARPFRKQQRRAALQEMQRLKRLQQWHVLYMGACLWCGQPFVSAESRRRYCSTACEKAFKHHRGHTKDTWLATHKIMEIGFHRYRGVCQWCEESFETDNPNQRNCKPLCGKYLFKAGGLSRRQWRAEVIVRQEAVREARRKLREALLAEKEARRQQREADRLRREADHRAEMARRAEERLEARIQRELDRQQAQALRAEARMRLLEERRTLKEAVREAARLRREAEREQRRARKEAERLQRKEAALARTIERRAQYLLSRGVDLARFEVGSLTEKESEEYRIYCETREQEWREKAKILTREEYLEQNAQKRKTFLEDRGIPVESLRDLLTPGTDAYRRYKAERQRDYRIKNADKLRRWHRMYYATHREQILQRLRLYYLANRDWINLRAKDERYEDFVARMAEQRKKEDALVRAEEEKLAATRIRFSEVEKVLLLPEEERYEFAKDWTDEERAYAASVLGSQGFGGAFAVTERELALDAGAFEPLLDE